MVRELTALEILEDFDAVLDSVEAGETIHIIRDDRWIAIIEPASLRDGDGDEEPPATPNPGG